MERMFSSARSFNQPLGQWDVSKNTNMSNMFRNASIYRYKKLKFNYIYNK